MAPLWPSEGPRTKTNLIIHSFLKTSKSTLRSNNSRSEVDLYKYAVLNVLQPLFAFICADFPPYKHSIVLCCSSTSVFVLRDQFVKTPCSRMKIKISSLLCLSFSLLVSHSSSCTPWLSSWLVSCQRLMSPFMFHARRGLWTFVWFF